MRRSNFALISALYSNPEAGLYRDIYFPIIKYSIECLLFEEIDNNGYYDVSDVQNHIILEFGIKIPLLVLKKSVRMLESSEINITIYEEGERFQIMQAWNHEPIVEIDRRREQFDQSFSVLEEQYESYKTREGMEDSRTFLDFITDNCDDILGYFEKNDISKVNQEYTIMAYFLEYLHQSDAELFKTANELFWGSIIAGFLMRQTPELEKLKDGECQEYYLDTNLAMSLLNLSTNEKHNYAKELIDIIDSAGCIARIHPITVMEITNILLSVEKNGFPRPNSEIAFAYERENLNSAKLAAIRVSLQEMLDKLHVSVMPTMQKRELGNIISSYTNKPVVSELRERYGRMHITDDKFQYIHDVYMHDFICQRRRQKQNGVFFVTMNNELRAFFNERDGERDSALIHPGKIVLELWMHHLTNADIKGYALTETMTRCLVMNNREIRHKLNIVARHYNDSLKDFKPEVYTAIILGLFKRDHELISSIDQLEQQEGTGNSEQIRQKMLSLGEKALAKAEHDDSRFSTIQAQLNNMEKSHGDLSAMLEQLHWEKKRAEQQMNDMVIAAKKERDIADLYRKKSELQDTLTAKQKDLMQLEGERSHSTSLKRYYFLILLPYVLLFGLAIAFIIGYMSLTSALMSTAVAIIIFIVQRFSDTAFNYAQIKHRVVAEQKIRWEEEHPEYAETSNEAQKIQQQIDVINKEISTS